MRVQWAGRESVYIKDNRPSTSTQCEDDTTMLTAMRPACSCYVCTVVCSCYYIVCSV